MRKSIAGIAVLLLALSGCYHAVIDTASPAGTQSIEIPWAHSFVYGLVPPSAVDSSTQCPSGVARVETKHSFLNGLVAAITWGLYTPMHIIVQCAAGEQAAALPLAGDRDTAEALLASGAAFLLPLRADVLDGTDRHGNVVTATQ